MKTSLLIIICLFLGALNSSAAFASDNFRFDQTIAIYHMVEAGGIIYVRPDEYDENQGFIKIYEALDQYLADLQQTQSTAFSPPDEQPLKSELILVNGEFDKKYLLKEGWLGDGENWVPMDRSDYQILWDLIDGRRNLPGSATAADELAEFTARLQAATDPTDIPAFDVQFGKSQKTNLQATTTSENAGTDKMEPKERKGTDDLPNNFSLPGSGQIPATEKTPVEATPTSTSAAAAAEHSPTKQAAAPQQGDDPSGPYPHHQNAEKAFALQNWQVIALISLATGLLMLFLRRQS